MVLPQKVLSGNKRQKQFQDQQVDTQVLSSNNKSSKYKLLSPPSKKQRFPLGDLTNSFDVEDEEIIMQSRNENISQGQQSLKSGSNGSSYQNVKVKEQKKENRKPLQVISESKSHSLKQSQKEQQQSTQQQKKQSQQQNSKQNSVQQQKVQQQIQQQNKQYKIQQKEQSKEQDSNSVKQIQDEIKNIDLVMGLDQNLFSSTYSKKILIQQRKDELQASKRPEEGYMENLQTQITPQHRFILVDWLIEATNEFRLSSDTLYLTVNYIDRCLSRLDTPKAQLQLLGATCLWVAAKFEEVYPPQVADLVYITDNAYSKQEFISMEKIILACLDFQFCVPYAKFFLRYYNRACETDLSQELLANYLCEMSQLDYYMSSKFLPSLIAASALILAMATCNKPFWRVTLRYYVGHDVNDLQICINAMFRLQWKFYTIYSDHSALERGNQSQRDKNKIVEIPAVFIKYQQDKYCRVSEIPPKISCPVNMIQLEEELLASICSQSD